MLGMLPVLAILALFQWWAVSSREREWWWFNGGPDHMAYADLHMAAQGKGHILIVERKSDEAPQTEFAVQWDCHKGQIAWGEAWTRDENFDQMDRSPAPADLRELHPPKNPMEVQFVELACKQGKALPQTFQLTKDQSPLELTKVAFDEVARGVQPHVALRRARNAK